ncbi:NACHT and WD repeat domain-containing protein [Actinophytocola sp.]|uniref:NACHT and WD repeat domain-containing protein n=1 Tax=Actinophytocola sp. TaxID=1872138 RepID=UPI00389A5E6F
MGGECALGRICGRAEVLLAAVPVICGGAAGADADGAGGIWPRMRVGGYLAAVKRMAQGGGQGGVVRMWSRRPRRRGGSSGLGLFLLGIGMGVLTNLVTARPERWPAWARPVVEWSWLIGATVVLAVSARAGWVWWRARLPRPEWTGGNPYPGLVAYDRDRAGVFFGRVDDVRDLARRVQSAAVTEQRFVPVVGPSGSGKSSLVLAGLLPSLGERWMVLPPITPGVSGVDEVAELLGTRVRGAARTVLAAVRDGGPAPAPVSVLRALRAARGTRQRVLLVVDQFEESAIQDTEGERQLFLALLYALVVHDPRLCVVVTVRSEWIGRFQQGPAAGLFMVPFMMNVLEPEQIRQVVDGPARLTDTVFEPGLVEQIVRDTGRGDALPLLSLLLGELYDGLGRDRYITKASYEQAGKVGGVIAARAEAALVASGHDLNTTLTTLLLFVNLQGEEPTRRRVRRDALTAAQQEVTAAFVHVHLLTSDHDPDEPGDPTGRVVYEVAHEALLRQWQPLAAHIETHRGTLRRITELLPLAQAWVNAGRPTSHLASAERLAELDAASTVVLPEPLAEFAAASMEHDAVERRRRANVAAGRARDLIGADPAAAISLSLAACTELAPTPTANTALYESLARGLRHVLTGHTGQVRCGSLAPDGRIASADDTGTIRIWAEDGALMSVLSGHTAPVCALAFASDGRLASGDEAGRVILWAADGRMIRQLEGDMRRVTSVVFAADGRLAAAGHHTACLWDVDGEPLRRATGEGELTVVAFTPDAVLITTDEDGEIQVCDSSGPEQCCLPSPDEKAMITALAVATDGRIAAGCQDGAVHVWPADHASLPTTPRAGFGDTDAPVRDLAFSDAGHLAATHTNGYVTIYRLGGMPTYRFPVGKAWTSLAYVPGGLLALAGHGEVRLYKPDRTVAFASAIRTDHMIILGFDARCRLVTADRAVYLWDLSTRVPPVLHNDRTTRFEVEVGPAGRLTTGSWSAFGADDHGYRRALGRHDESCPLAFGPHGVLAVVTGMSVEVWSADGVPLLDLPRQQNLRHLVFAPDMRLATAGDDPTVLVWDTAGQLQHTLEHDSPVRRLSFAPDDRLVTATTTGTVRIWGTAGELLHELNGHKDQVEALAFAADGRLATGSADRTVRVWDRDGALLHTLIGHTQPVVYLAFAPDGGLVSGSHDGTVRTWSHDGSLMHVLDVPGRLAGGLAVTDAGLIVAGEEGGTIRVWTPDGRLLYELPGNTSGIAALALAPDGNLITAGRNGTLRRWPAPIPLPDLIAAARRCTLPPLTPAIRHDWMLPGAPQLG